MIKKHLLSIILFVIVQLANAQSVSLTPGHATCGGSDGTITAVGSGGSGSGYTYSLDDVDYSNTTGIFTGLTPGDYTVWVQDDALGKGSNTVTISELLQASSSKTDITTCYGNTEGTITITASCGITTDYSYDWSGSPIDPGNVSSATNLVAGSYNIVVSNGSGESIPLNVTINEPTEVSLSVSQTSTYNCDGNLEVILSGGTSPYDVNSAFGAEVDVVGPLSYTGVDDQLYSFTVTDDNGCSPSGGAVEITVQIDAAAPTYSNMPGNYSTDYLTFASGFNTGVVVVGPTTLNFTSSSSDDQSYDYYDYTNVNYSFDVAQSGAVPTASDILSVSYSLNGGTDWSTPTDYAGDINGSNITGSIPLDNDPNNNTDVRLRISVVIVTGSLQYDITNYEITADERFNAGSIDPSTSGEPTFDDDLSGIDVVSFSDGAANWICSDPGNPELYFLRSWTGIDNCGKSTTTTDQLISIGQAPTIDMSANGDITYDFCDLTHSIAAPGVSDNCSSSGNITVDWSIDEQVSGDNRASGSGGIVDHVFAVDETVIITWTATDEAGLQTTATQTIIVLPEISASFTASETDICLGESVTFTLVVTGGTGTYNTYSYTPSGGSWSDPDYSTTGLDLVTNYLSVEITDGDISGTTGGCTSSAQTSGTVNVWELVPTGGVSRD